MQTEAGDSVPQAVIRKLATYPRGPAWTPQKQRNTQLWAAHALHEREQPWTQHCFAEVETESAAVKARVHSRQTAEPSSKYCLKYYAFTTADSDAQQQEHDSHADKIAALQQETQAMQLAYQEQQAALHRFAERKVKAGKPFARPGLQHPPTIGAAHVVPNNRLEHSHFVPTTPDLTKDRPLVWPAQIPLPRATEPMHGDTQRRQAVPRLHCRAFDFPVASAAPTLPPQRSPTQGGTCEVRRTRPFQMLGSGYKVKHTAI